MIIYVMIRLLPNSTRTDTRFPDTTLFRAIGDIAPERNNLRRGPALGIDLHHRSPVDHRYGEVRAMMQRDGCDRAMLRKRSEEHTSELQSLMRISYAVFCLKNKM